MKEILPYCLLCGTQLNKDTDTPLTYFCTCGASFAILDYEGQIICPVCASPNFIGDFTFNSIFNFHQVIYFCSNADCPAYTIDMFYAHHKEKNFIYIPRLLHNSRPILILDSEYLCIYISSNDFFHDVQNIDWRINTNLYDFLHGIITRFKLQNTGNNNV